MINPAVYLQWLSEAGHVVVEAKAGSGCLYCTVDGHCPRGAHPIDCTRISVNNVGNFRLVMLEDNDT
jgi:hypothetical protein